MTPTEYQAHHLAAAAKIFAALGLPAQMLTDQPQPQPQRGPRMRIEQPFETYHLETNAAETIAEATLNRRDQAEALVTFGEAPETHTFGPDELRGLARFFDGLAARLSSPWLPEELDKADDLVHALSDPDAT